MARRKEQKNMERRPLVLVIFLKTLVRKEGQETKDGEGVTVMVSGGRAVNLPSL